MSIGLPGWEEDSTIAEPAMRTRHIHIQVSNPDFRKPANMSIPLTLRQKPYHAEPGVEYTTSPALVLVMMPVAPFLGASDRELDNENEGVDDNFCNGKIAFLSGNGIVPRHDGCQMRLLLNGRVVVVVKYNLEMIITALKYTRPKGRGFNFLQLWYRSEGWIHRDKRPF